MIFMFLFRCGVFGLLSLVVLPAIDFQQDIQTVAKQGRGTAEGRAAWDRVVDGGPDLLLPLLEAMDTPDTVAANWVRTAFDQIAERELSKGGKTLDANGLLKFAVDTKRNGRARRLALELVEKLRPGTSVKLYAGWLEDPEFRYEAVGVLLTEARKLAKAGDKDKADFNFHKALDASRDLQQGRDAAAGLLALGVKASVAEHMGFLMDWYLIGPFDAGGMKGFSTVYPPELSIDLTAEYAGKNGKVKWKRYKVEEPSPKVNAKHIALVNLAEKRALGNADDAVAFAYSEIVVAKAMTVEFRGAADDNFTVWVNGERAFGFEEYRNGVRLDRHRFQVKLRAGKNSVLVKICQSPANPEPNWEFLLRVVDLSGRGLKFMSALQPREMTP
jgi:hypothetical protein